MKVRMLGADKERVFLDFNATNRVYPEVLTAIAECVSLPLNPSSVHGYGQKARAMLREQAKALAALFGVHWMDVIWTSGATEANNLGILGSAKKRISDTQGKTVYMSPTAHPSVTRLQAVLEDWGLKIAWLPVVSAQDPIIDMDRARACFEAHPPYLVAFEWVNNEYGAVQPIDALYELAADLGAYVHIDAVQAFGRLPPSVSSYRRATIAYSGHKYGGIGGHGILIKPSNLHLEPLVFGGSQQDGMRAGTVSLPLVSAQVQCMQKYESSRQYRVRHTLALQKHLESSLQKLFETLGPGEILGNRVDRISNTTMFRVSGVNAETLMMALDLDGIMISTGSACSSGSLDPSSGLAKIGFSPKEAMEFVRVSTNETTTKIHLDRLLASVATCVKKCRKLGQ